MKEIEVPDDFMQGYCDTLIKSFCYKVEENSISVYLYKDFSLLESIQEQDSLREELRSNSYSLSVEHEFRICVLEASV